MVASRQLQELHETCKETADCKTCLCHVAPGGRQRVAPRMLEVLPAACCHSHCWIQQAPAGIYSRGGGLAAVRCDRPGCLERWEFERDGEGFGLSGARGVLRQGLGGGLG